MNLRPPFVPSWISDEALLANTLVVEALLAVAVFWFVVRRASGDGAPSVSSRRSSC